MSTDNKFVSPRSTPVTPTTPKLTDAQKDEQKDAEKAAEAKAKADVDAKLHPVVTPVTNAEARLAAAQAKGTVNVGFDTGDARADIENAKRDVAIAKDPSNGQRNIDARKARFEKVIKLLTKYADDSTDPATIVSINEVIADLTAISNQVDAGTVLNPTNLFPVS